MIPAKSTLRGVRCTCQVTTEWQSPPVDAFGIVQSRLDLGCQETPDGLAFYRVAHTWP